MEGRISKTSPDPEGAAHEVKIVPLVLDVHQAADHLVRSIRMPGRREMESFRYSEGSPRP